MPVRLAWTIRQGVPQPHRQARKVAKHAHAAALRMMDYNFIRIHKTLRVRPAMTAGVTVKLWEIGDVVAVLEK